MNVCFKSKKRKLHNTHSPVNNTYSIIILVTGQSTPTQWKKQQSEQDEGLIVCIYHVTFTAIQFDSLELLFQTSFYPQVLF